MADQKISELNALTSPAIDDLFAIVDTGAVETKKITFENLDIALNKVSLVASTDNAIPRFNGSAGQVQNSGVTIDDNNNIYIPGTIGVGTLPTVKPVQTIGAINSITSTVRGTSVEFIGQDAANLAAYPRAFFYGYSGSSIVNFGLYAASGNATGSTQTPVFFGVSTNASDTQANSIQFINYADTTKAYIAAFRAGSGVRPVPIYLGHATQPDITIATNTYIGFGNVINPTARLSLAAATFPAGGIAFGTDTYLYRSAADTLRTDDTFVIGTQLDLTPIAAANPSIKANATTDTPTTTWSSGATVTNPSGFIEISVGGNTRYIPFYA